MRALRNRKGVPTKKCEPGCTCGHHARTKYKSCEPGCTCGRHIQTDEHRRKNAEANRGRKKSAEAVRRQVETRKANGSYHQPAVIQALREGFERMVAEDPTKHPGYVDGRTAHPEYNRWYNMMARCLKPEHPMYPSYGGRGITVCAEWQTPANFYGYLEGMGPCPPGYSLDRINNNGNYEPGNIRWASQSEQNSNRNPYSRST